MFSELSLPLTKRAQKAISLAGKEARRLGKADPAAEHLLLGILAEGAGVAALVLKNMGATLGRVHQDIKAARAPETPPSADLNSCIERAEGLSLRLNHFEIGTEHLLLAILKSKGELDPRVFSGLNIDGAAVKDVLLEVLAQPRDG